MKRLRCGERGLGANEVEQTRSRAGDAGGNKSKTGAWHRSEKGYTGMNSNLYLQSIYRVGRERQRDMIGSQVKRNLGYFCRGAFVAVVPEG